MEAKRNKGWRWRDGELNVREYNKLSNEERRKYLDMIKSLQPEERSSCDDYLIQMSSYKPDPDNNKKFLEL